jgi:hypothetical protein
MCLLAGLPESSCGRIRSFPCPYYSTRVLHAHILPGGLTIYSLVAADQRRSLAPSTWSSWPMGVPCLSPFHQWPIPIRCHPGQLQLLYSVPPAFLTFNVYRSPSPKKRRRELTLTNQLHLLTMSKMQTLLVWDYLDVNNNIQATRMWDSRLSPR